MPRKGEVWTITGDVPRTVLVISGDMYNDLSDWPYVLTMEIVHTGDVAVPAPITIPVGEDQLVLVDSIRQTAKPLFDRLTRRVESQAISDAHNALFRILATN